MNDHVYKTIEITGSSHTSPEDVTEQAAGIEPMPAAFTRAIEGLL